MTDLVILWIAHQLLGWGWPPFLTAAWDEVLGVVSLSLVAAAVVVIAIFLKSKKIKMIAIQLAIALSILTLGSLAYTSSLGGKIRHPEIDIVHQDQD